MSWSAEEHGGHRTPPSEALAHSPAFFCHECNKARQAPSTAHIRQGCYNQCAISKLRGMKAFSRKTHRDSPGEVDSYEARIEFFFFFQKTQTLDILQLG